MRYLIPLLLAAAIPLSSLAEGLGTTAVHHGPAAKHMTLAGAKKTSKAKKAKKAPKAKKAKKAKKAPKAKKSRSGLFHR
jgi:hypothetical protein